MTPCGGRLCPEGTPQNTTKIVGCQYAQVHVFMNRGRTDIVKREITINFYHMQHTQYPSLLVVCNSEVARWVDIERESTEEVAAVFDAKDRYSDREGMFGKNGRGVMYQGGEPDVLNGRKQDHLLHHIRGVAKKTAEHWKQHGYTALTFVAPAKIKGMLEKELRRYLPQISILAMAGNYVHLPVRHVRTMWQKQWRLH